MLNKEMSKIDWENKSALEIKNLVRGLNPIMGTYSNIDNKKIKIWKVEVVKIDDFIEEYTEFKDYKNRLDKIQSGTIIYINNQKGVYVKAKDDIILLLEVQAENAKKMSIQDYLRGTKLNIGEVLNN